MWSRGPTTGRERRPIKMRYRSHTSPTARPGDSGMPLRSCLGKGHRHPFLPREVSFGIGGIFLARIFRLVGHIGAEVGHDLSRKQLHGSHDLRVRDLAQVEGTVQVSDASILSHAVDLLRDNL